MLDFLSENYIWFFVGAIVLLFALIGFIVEGKKKKNKEFKGQSVPENVDSVENATKLEVNDIPVNDNISEMQSTQGQGVLEPQSISEINVPNNSAGMNANDQNPVEPINENQTVTIGEPIEVKNDPVIPTAPESFYDEPLMPNTNQEEKPMSFEINSNQNIDNERQ